MDAFETSATVEADGQVHLAGVPFAPGTEVEITINPKARSTDEVRHSEEALASMRELFRTVKGFRNSPRIPREELYDRGRLH